MSLRTVLCQAALLLGVALALGASLAGCPRPSSPPPPLPDPSETPPRTKDPGAVWDKQPLQPSPPVGPERRSAAEPPRIGKLDGAACLSAAECGSGICEGQGCTDDLPGRCAPRSRACTKDLRQYCGCDGRTFAASGSCPGRRFASRAPCGSR